ncbi:MAG: 2-C-methyl-D-erythritol 2,4-cyclodiphosphate synthase [Porticoccaceae bacterium]|nr:MAG: 2-C-methyl-D-erythritol 2,4-cyclodiphosphate synthase [Porticoccaceae bacterium]
MKVRVGHGYDVHRFGPGDGLVLGGVWIPYPRGLVAHSDGDVVLHALCDALLGAAALGDIGQHFPPSDPTWAGVDSRLLLRRVVALLAERGYAPVNVDLTVIAEAPKLAPHLPAMVANLSTELRLAPEAVNVKATTTEGLGFPGRGEGIACHAVALIAAP